jgi:hypothetical protein
MARVCRRTGSGFGWTVLGASAFAFAAVGAVPAFAQSPSPSTSPPVSSPSSSSSTSPTASQLKKVKDACQELINITQSSQSSSSSSGSSANNSNIALKDAENCAAALASLKKRGVNFFEMVKQHTEGGRREIAKEAQETIDVLERQARRAPPNTSGSNETRDGLIFRFMGQGEGSSTKAQSGHQDVGFVTPKMKSTQGSGGLLASWNGSNLVGGNQQLQFLAYVGEGVSHTRLGTTPGLTGDTGTINANALHYGGGFTYSLVNFYMTGLVEGQSGSTRANNFSSGENNRYGTDGFSADLTAGWTWKLFGVAPPARITKAPPVIGEGIRSVWLDVSAHIGYDRFRGDSFTDSTGLTTGALIERYGTVGAAAKIYWLTVGRLGNSMVVWTPYLGVTYDHEFSYSHTLAVPAMGEVFTFLQAHDYVGGQVGTILYFSSAVSASAEAYVKTSSDTTIYGGMLSLKYALLPPR